MVDYVRDGRESEWNEAAFKSKRLHEIQELINHLRMDPLRMDRGKFYYLILLSVITILYKEGRSKYSAKEKEEVDKIEDNCNKFLIANPPHIQKITSTFNKRGEVRYLLNNENYFKFMSLLDYYENKVKDYNDAHGLTTKNKRKGGMF